MRDCVTPPLPAIRAARREELLHLAALERRAAERFSDDLLPVTLRGRTVPLAQLEAACDAGLLWVAALPYGDLVGFLVATMEDGFAHLVELSVLPSRGRQGLGTALLAALRAWAHDHGALAVTLTTFEQVPWNAPWYRRQGFVPVPAAACPLHLQRHLADEHAAGLRQRVALWQPLHAGAAGPSSA